jgi:hypothetical protein
VALNLFFLSKNGANWQILTMTYQGFTKGEYNSALPGIEKTRKSIWILAGCSWNKKSLLTSPMWFDFAAVSALNLRRTRMQSQALRVKFSRVTQE